MFVIENEVRSTYGLIYKDNQKKKKKPIHCKIENSFIPLHPNMYLVTTLAINSMS